MNFSRKTILVVGAALLAAACGDKVTVKEYPITPPASKINFVEVTPATATVSTGASITFTAAVNADAGLATTVTWSASAGTVTSAGVFTAPATANPGVSVCATSTVDTGKKGCASVVVTAAPATIPATVSINSITAAGNLNAPVNPAAVAGQIDVTLNVNPGNQTVAKVELLVGGQVAGSQTFTAAQSAALRYAVDEAIAAQSTFPQVVFSVNTAAFSATTGVPTWLNGAQAVQAKLYTTASGTSTAATASVTQNLTFANVDGFAITTSGGTSAVDGAGYRWTGNGSLTVNALPVMYSGSTIGTVNAALSANPATGSTCVAATGAVGAATTKTGDVYAITGTLAGLQSPAGCTTNFPNVITITATNGAGDNLTLVGTATTPAGVIGAQSGLRWDNIAPPTAGLTAALAVNGRTGNWINDGVILNTVTAAGNLNGAIAAAVVDAGIGGAISYNVRVGSTYAAAKTAAALANTTTLNAGTAGSATNADWCAIAFTADLLGNTQSGGPTGTCAAPTTNGVIYVLPVAGVASVPFGVDRADPTIAYSGGLAANAQIATATVAAEFSVTVSDTGLVGNSGMLPVSPVKMQISQRSAGAANSAGTTACFNANMTAAVCGTQTATGVAVATPIYTTAFAATTTDAYFTFNATAYDAAGNWATVSSRVVAHDDGALTVGAVSSPITVSTIGWTGNAFLNDALDIANYWFDGNYSTLPGPFAAGPSAAPLQVGQTATTVNGFNAATFVNTNYAISAAVNVPLALQVAGTLYPLDGVRANATNAGGLVVNGALAATPAVAPALVVFAPAGLASFPAVTNSIASNMISSGVTTAATAANPASGTLSVVSTGPTATYNNPFARVDFYAVNNGGAAGTEWRFIGSASTPTLTDNGAVRTFSWSLPISGATLYTQLGYTATAATNVMAVGMNAAGTIGYVNAAFYALTIIK